MTNRVRAAVLAVSLPVLAFAVIGGFLGRDAAAQGGSYQHLKIFEDVVTLILNNYVEEVDVDKVMHGAMHGLADGLDPDSAYLDARQMKTVDAPATVRSVLPAASPATVRSLVWPSVVFAVRIVALSPIRRPMCGGPFRPPHDGPLDESRT